MYCGQVPTDTPAVMYLTTLLVSLIVLGTLKLTFNKEKQNFDSDWSMKVALVWCYLSNDIVIFDC